MVSIKVICQDYLKEVFSRLYKFVYMKGVKKRERRYTETNNKVPDGEGIFMTKDSRIFSK